MSIETTETKPYMVTLTGPSGSGKTTILNKLLESGKFTPLISTTTRPKRIGEIEGKDYNFVDKELFERDLQQGFFAQHVEFKGNYYGTSVDELGMAFGSGLIPICIVEPGGVGQFEQVGRGLNFEVIPVLVTAGLITLMERCLKRVIDEGIDYGAACNAIGAENVTGNAYDNLKYHAVRLTNLMLEYDNWGNTLSDMNSYMLRYLNDDSSSGPKSIPHLVDALTTRRFDVYDFVSHKNDPTTLKPNVSQS